MLKRIIILSLVVFSSLTLAAEDEEGAEPVKKTASYVSLGKPMVLNLSTNKSRLTFLQLSVDILVEGDDAKEAVTAHIPAIRHNIILLLSEQKAIDMKSPAKRNDIRKIATDQVKELVEELASIKDVSDVLFSSFLIQ